MMTHPISLNVALTKGDRFLTDSVAKKQIVSVAFVLLHWANDVNGRSYTLTADTECYVQRPECQLVYVNYALIKSIASAC